MALQILKGNALIFLASFS